jgi:hypothetical protein
MTAQNQRQLGLAPVGAPAPSRASFLTEVTVEHGPAPLLGRFFLAAETAARENGVTISFATPDDLLATNEAHRETWKPLLSVFDPRFHAFTPENCLVLVGRNAAGEIVATQAARVLRLQNGSLHDEMVSLRLSYDDPARDRMPNEAFDVTAAAPKTIRGTALFGGGVWYRPDYRKRGLAAILPRISRALAYTRWNTDYTTSMMAVGIANGGVAQASGYRHVEPEIRIRNSRMGDLTTHFMFMRPSELLADLETYLDGLTTQIDTAVGQRRA